MILLDTDVLIDLALDRQPHAPAAARLIDSIEQGDQRACIAWHTISNFYYIVAPSRGRENVKKIHC
ncbi:MAG: type II toxin-antitoxin system VapC family toxin [Gammaproteobacteria bacterium]|nr:type II toxin-antitoxin system VapC family toxin [Gammaproteobacteria bacterium]MYH85571.1 type II toxin-antitoxin system VapC family toxin [Gammaproteobacteria bacterium]MYK04692.1 type II toxin-antitoxin system VapC family toxin [Gammaproteobacteria bacterium]